jgi:hypothetical protein
MENREPSSFRDPSGMVFEKEGRIYRRINAVYMPCYERLMNSGLYTELTKDGYLIAHKEIEFQDCGAKIIQPEEIPFISYPYEWCFEQYRDAALLTLQIQRLAMRHDMLLKDASAYNVQFKNGKTVFIDTLSFEMYDEGPWPAYGQFCRHFFAPLLLMSCVDTRLGKMTQNYIDGIPIDLAALLLHGKGGFAAWQHIRLHAASIKRFSGSETVYKNNGNTPKITKKMLEAIIDGLIRSVEKMKIREESTEWGDYYQATNYTSGAAEQKAEIVDEFLRKIAPFKTVWDMGANDGRYSRLALKYDADVAAFDIDHKAVSHNYLTARKNGESLLPLLLDINAPSPAIGFANAERKTITGRRLPDLTLMLALIHHMVISNNLPLEMIASYIASFTSFLIIEFVPKSDSQVQRLLKTRIDIFNDYTQDHFETAFSAYFTMLGCRHIENTERTLYLFQKRDI